jgi:LAS superfamily LD-carboxypeptidase LdcB
MLNSLEFMGCKDTHVVRLDTIDPSNKSGKMYLQQATAEAFLDLQESASAAGVDCQIVSSFRSFERQLQIWNRKWRGELAVLNDKQEPIDLAALDNNEKCHAILRWSALPGASRHHWGTDIDVYDQRATLAAEHQLKLIPSEYYTNGVCSNLFIWLTQYAKKFGFTQPYALDTGGIGVEPWHLSYAPIANPLLEQYPQQELYDKLQESDIEGKSIILEQFDSILHRYVFI